MLGNVIKFFPSNAAKDPDLVLEQAKGLFNDVFVMGYDEGGEMDARASMDFSVKDILFCMDIFRFKLLNGEYETHTPDKKD